MTYLVTPSGTGARGAVGVRVGSRAAAAGVRRPSGGRTRRLGVALIGPSTDL
jgi:hypothetical protein